MDYLDLLTAIEEYVVEKGLSKYDNTIFDLIEALAEDL